MVHTFLNRLVSRSSRTQAPRPHGFRPRLETLEDRCVPAFTAAFNPATGALTVTGTAAADVILFGERATQGEYDVGDTVNPFQFFSGVKSITVDTQGAPAGSADAVTLGGTNSANSFLTGALNITGSGSLKVGFASNFNVRGAVAISTTSSVGALTVQTGTATQFQRQANVTLGSTTITNRGAGGAVVQLYGVNANDVTIAGLLSATFGSGSNSQFYLLNVAVSGGVVEFGSGTATDVSFGVVNISGFVSVNGSGNSGTSVRLIHCSVGTFFSVVGGNGPDSVNVDNTSVLGLGLQPQQQTFGVDLKGGTNQSRIGTGGPYAYNVIHGSLFHYGAGTETFDLRNYTITSFVTINAQVGNSGITANISVSKISGFLSFAASEAHDDYVTVDNLSIGQNFGMDLGGGANRTIITNNTYLGSYFESDSGYDSITFNNNTGFGDVRLSGTTLTVGSSAFLNDRIAGNASFISTGGGGDVVVLGPAFGVAPSEANVVSIGKTLTINLGIYGSDALTTNNVIVKGDMTVTVLTSEFTNMSVGGNLIVDAGAASARARVNLGVVATNAGAIQVVGNLTVTTGSGNDGVEVIDVAITGITTINTNAGVDDVDLEIRPGNPGSSKFFGAVSVSTGSEDDRIFLGADAANTSQFFSTVLFDGGSGSDTLTETAVNYYGGPPTKTSIP